MTPEQALQILANLVANTKGFPHETDALREAIQVLAVAIARPITPEPPDDPDG